MQADPRFPPVAGDGRLTVRTCPRMGRRHGGRDAPAAREDHMTDATVADFDRKRSRDALEDRAARGAAALTANSSVIAIDFPFAKLSASISLCLTWIGLF